MAKKIARLTGLGSLVIKKCAELNACLMAKIKWNCLTKILIQKYGRNLELKTSNRPFVRRSLNKDLNIFNLGLKRTITYGQDTSFWNDFWLPNGTLNINDHNMLVSDVLPLSDSLSPNISFTLPQEILREIKATPFSLSNDIKDQISWHSASDGIFTVKSAYIQTFYFT